MNQPNRPGMRNSKIAPQTQKEDTVEDMIQRGRMLAEHNVHSFIPGLRASTTIIEPKIPTMGIDKYWRTYWNPRAVQWMCAAAQAVSKDHPCNSCKAHSHQKYAYLAGIWIHEIGHQIFRHAKRMEEAGYTDRVKGNIAQDAEMNDDIPEIGTKAQAWCADARNQHQPCPAMCMPSKVMVNPDEYKIWNEMGSYAYTKLTGKDMWDVFRPVGAGLPGDKELPFLVFPEAIPTGRDEWTKLEDHKIFELYYEQIPDGDNTVTLCAISHDPANPGNVLGQAATTIVIEPKKPEVPGMGETK